MTSRTLAALALAAATSVCAPVRAQDLPVGAVVSSASLSGIAAFDTDLDAGGSMRWDAGLLLGLNKESPRAQLRAQLGYQF